MLHRKKPRNGFLSTLSGSVAAFVDHVTLSSQKKTVSSLRLHGAFFGDKFSNCRFACFRSVIGRQTFERGALASVVYETMSFMRLQFTEFQLERDFKCPTMPRWWSTLHNVRLLTYQQGRFLYYTPLNRNEERKKKTEIFAGATP